MKRTFIAVKIIPNEKMRDILSRFRNELAKERIKWVDPGSMHITLCFMGDTREELIHPMKEEIKQAVSLFPPVKFIFKGCGIFRNIRDPRVIWIGLESDPGLAELKMHLDGILEPFGFAPEKRDFKPHLTLGRIKGLTDASILEDLVREYSNIKVQEFETDRVIFYESILQPEGPRYIPLLEAKLSGPAKKVFS